MGTSAPGTIVVTTVPAWEDTTDTMMKQFVVLLCLLPFTLCSAEAEASADGEADADPGYGRYYGHGGRYGYLYAHGRGHGHYGPKCHVTYEVVTSQECHTVPETVCHTEHVTNYVTKTEQQCATHSVPDCGGHHICGGVPGHHHTPLHRDIRHHSDTQCCCRSCGRRPCGCSCCWASWCSCCRPSWCPCSWSSWCPCCWASWCPCSWCSSCSPCSS